MQTSFPLVCFVRSAVEANGKMAATNREFVCISFEIQRSVAKHSHCGGFAVRRYGGGQAGLQIAISDPSASSDRKFRLISGTAEAFECAGLPATERGVAMSGPISFFFLVIGGNTVRSSGSSTPWANPSEHAHARAPTRAHVSLFILTVDFVVFVLPVLDGHHIQRGSVGKH